MYTKKLYLAFVVAMACICANFAYGQTLFTYNGIPVGTHEFLQAFNKNPDTTGDRVQKLKDYLGMYINFKLKLQEAYNEKLESKDEFKDEVQNFKNQLTENYVNSQANINQLVHEAFVRSQKDILLSEVFVAAPAGTDTATARQKIQAGLDALNAGKSFEDVTATYTTDEYIKQQKGIIGYITAFTLPCQLENMVYALRPGGYTGIYHSAAGYHIFSNAGERKAAGKRKIQQILLPVGKGFSVDEKKAVAQKADSLYRLVIKNGGFDELAVQYANPGMGGQQNGITNVGVGMYSPAFEAVVYGLQKPGDITRPFENEYGYNIIKLLEVLPVADKEDDVVNQQALQQLVSGDDRLTLAKNNLLKQWLVITKYKKAQYSDAGLWAYTDSALAGHKKAVKGVDSATVIFSFPAKKITAGDWVAYVKPAREQGVTAGKTYPELLNEFVNQSCNEYYRSHIEEYNASIKDQMQEFNEANLLFAVMDKHVWGKASQDTAALLQYYTAHKQNYTWAPGVSALTVTSASKDIVDSVALQVKAAPAQWRKITAEYNNLVTADSSRYENGQLPVKQTIPLQAGFASAPEQAQGGGPWTFVYVFNAYTQTQPRSFDDAKGMVINDYQQILENTWLESLKKKYPVKVNEDVLKGLK